MTLVPTDDEARHCAGFLHWWVARAHEGGNQLEKPMGETNSNSCTDYTRQIRAHALEAALRTEHPVGRDHHSVLQAAKAYEAYLKGEYGSGK